MRKYCYIFICVMSFIVTGSAYGLDFDFSGTFSQDNDVALLNFNVGADSTITIFSSSWGDSTGDPNGYKVGGGFDPILAIWDSNGDLISEQDDGVNVGYTESNGVSYFHGIWDSYYEIDLTAGQYTASIAQYDNFAAGSTLSAGFTYDNDPHFTFTLGYGPQPDFNGVWDDADWRTGNWEFHILNVDDAHDVNPVPEPATLVLFGIGLVGIAGAGIKRSKKS